MPSEPRNLPLELRAIAGAGIRCNPQYFPPQGSMGRDWPRTLEAAADQIDTLEAELQRLCGPVCPHDWKRAIEHYYGRSWLRSFAEPTPLKPHVFEPCLDCDELSSYHDEDNYQEHCDRCSESREACDGSPLIGGNVPSHPDWPEGEQWLRERERAGR